MIQCKFSHSTEGGDRGQMNSMIQGSLQTVTKISYLYSNVNTH